MQSRITSYKHIYLEFSIKYLYCRSRGQSGFVILSLLFAFLEVCKNARQHAFHILPIPHHSYSGKSTYKLAEETELGCLPKGYPNFLQFSLLKVMF